MDSVKYSIVIPLYNEESGLPTLVERLQELMAQFDGPAEVVMVDDGSRDATYQLAQAASLQDFELPGFLPGIKANTSPTDFAPLSQLQLMRIKGQTWERFGDIISSDVGG